MNEQKEASILYRLEYSKSNIVIAIIMYALGAAGLYLLFSKIDLSIWFYIFWFVIIVVLCYQTVCWGNYNIVIDNEELVLKRLLGKEYRFLLEDVKAIDRCSYRYQMKVRFDTLTVSTKDGDTKLKVTNIGKDDMVDLKAALWGRDIEVTKHELPQFGS